MAAGARNVKALHRAGQTFITFTEPGPPQPKDTTWGKVRAALAKSNDRFRLCASDRPITAANIARAEPLGEVRRFSGCNLNGRNVEYLIAQAMMKPDRSAPLPSCKADLTPRHCQKFKPVPGQKLKWTNTALPPKAKGNEKAGTKSPASQTGGEVLAAGTVVADKWGLATLEQITVTKTGNRIIITKR
ncbi:MAG: hypothetical protein B1H04_03990 [Planctomycetales bacterium 4484_123]|nr:MAG: hypothetical protein B1H04_03990 [Planctomycetales bacterium 4484_123]